MYRIPSLSKPVHATGSLLSQVKQALSMNEPEDITEPCPAPGCDRPVRACGLCDSHYRQSRRHGRTFRLARYQRSTLPQAQEAA